jgi:predicted transcriptional regulator
MQTVIVAVCISSPFFWPNLFLEVLTMPTIFKLARIQSNMKALEVARKADIYYSRLSLIENGWVTPTAAEIEKLKRVIPKLKEELVK